MFRVLYQIARADFLERTRRYSFLVTTGILIYLAYLSFPPIDTKYLVVSMRDYRGIYNSAWVGSSIALLCNTLLALVGFYLINNSIKRDDTTGVGQIIAATPITKWEYLFGKFFSNLVFLMSMVGIVAVAAIGMQLYRAESATIELWKFFSPIIITTIPMMALVSAVALLFESVRFLRGGIGNVLYYGLLMATLMTSIGFENEYTSKDLSPRPFGVSLIVGSMQKAAYENFPHDYKGGFEIGGSPVRNHVITFVWDGVDWNLNIILWRLFWIGVSFLITLMVTLFFKRFDQSYQYRKKKMKKNKIPDEEQVLTFPVYHNRNIQLTPLAENKTGRLVALVITVTGELKIMLKGLYKIWYLAALALIVVSITIPINVARQFIVPFAWVWPILIWSKMGNKEFKYRTNQYVFSSPYPVLGQLPALWLAGFFVALITGIGWPVRMFFAGELSLITVWIVGAAFIPSLALALGIWTGSSKMFEVIYFILWYVGPMDQTPFLDFIGITGNKLVPGTTFTFFAITLILIVFSLVGRRRQVYV